MGIITIVMDKVKILQLGHGFNKGGILKGNDCPTITSSSWQFNNLLLFIKNGRILMRRFTPDECFRLMGFQKGVSVKASMAGVSDSALYKQADNGIVTDCIGEISESIYHAYFENKKQ